MAAPMTSNVTDLCRLCGTDTLSIVRHPIFEADGVSRRLANKITECLPVVVTEQDRLPKIMCGECVYKLDLLSEFRNNVVKTEHLLESLVDGVKPEIIENEEHDDDFGADDDFRSSSPELEQNEPEVLIKEEEALPVKRPRRAAAAAAAAAKKPGKRGRKRKQTEGVAEEAPTKAAKRSVDEEQLPEKPREPKKRGRKPKDHKESAGRPRRQRRYVCCGRSFASARALRSHACSATLQALLTCDFCERRYESQEAIRRHIRRQHLLAHACSACPARFESGAALDAHVATCVPAACSRCGLRLPSAAAVARHVRATHDARFVCRFCGKRFALRTKLTDHERAHTDERPFECALCPRKAFTSKAYLLAHMKHVHVRVDDASLACDVCAKTFASLKGLRSHRVTHFDELKRFVCRICKAAFHARHNLASHHLVHTGEKAFRCEHCAAPFTRRSSLKAHIGFKHGREVAAHVCPVCSKRFPQTSHLKRHLLTHTGERSHLCDLCGKRFSQVAHLHTHKRLRHKVLPYECGVCGRQFKLKTDLLTHMGEH